MIVWRKPEQSNPSGNCVEVGMQEVQWRKSTRSANSSDCVEVGMEPVQWATSTRSGGGECVEVGRTFKTSAVCGSGSCVEVSTGTPVLVRDTKDRDGGTIPFPPAAWTAFVDAVARGEIGR